MPLGKKLQLMKHPIKAWNKQVFGHIDHKLRVLQDAIAKLEKEAQNRQLEEHEWSRMDALKSQLGLWMIRKERYWKQLSRCKIIKEGDRNTKYFHLIASARRQRNVIERITANGKEVTDIREIKDYINGYFRRLYKRRKGLQFDISYLNMSKLQPEEASRLESQVTRQEIKEALFSCDPSKAPGYDGFNLKCIRKMWHVIDEDFYTAILDFFETGNLHCSFNTTWVILVPKKSEAKEVTDYRPISLVGSVYKVIAKILSKRLRSVLPALVGETQSAFVEGRQILDGALIANETVQWMKIKKKAGVLLKLDFQKAYDTIDWSALQMVLHEMGFGDKWRSWISQCVSTASISIIINGSPSKPFKMGRGLRQGDPLSPFRFVLMAEVLNKMLMKALALGQIKGLRVGAADVLISHLQFADDTLLFCEADVQQLCFIKNLLLSFQALSELAVNYHKSALIVIGKDDVWAKETAGLLECTRAQLPIVYLGIPLGANMKKAASWKTIIDKIQKRLQAWKGCCLSRAGRLTLILSLIHI